MSEKNAPGHDSGSDALSATPTHEMKGLLA